MDAKHLFVAEDYFRGLTEKNILAQEHKFFPCTCSGIESLQGPLEKFRSSNAFVCVDDTNDGAMFRGKNGGYFKQRTFTVFILHRYKFGNEDDRRAKLSLCRDIFRQFASKMIVDSKRMSNELIYLQTDNILSRELGQYFMNGCTGLYFMIDVSEPVDLKFDSAEWHS